jgi:hypothetical protein
VVGKEHYRFEISNRIGDMLNLDAEADIIIAIGEKLTVLIILTASVV